MKELTRDGMQTYLDARINQAASKALAAAQLYRKLVESKKDLKQVIMAQSDFNQAVGELNAFRCVQYYLAGGLK